MFGGALDGLCLVEVEFDSDSTEYRVKAEWSDGGLSIETESGD